MKRNYHTLNKQGKATNEDWPSSSSRTADNSWPMADLIAQSRIAIEDLVDSVGRTTIEAVLRLPAEQVAGHRSGAGHARVRSTGTEPRTAAFI